MDKIVVLTPADLVGRLEKESMVNFLDEHLGNWRAKKETMLKAIDYSLSRFLHQGGFIALAKELDKTIGVAVINETKMDGLMPQNTLMYLAVHKSFRKQGIGKELMKTVIALTKGNLNILLDKTNDSLGFFEKLGFENRLLDMRLQVAQPS